MPWIKGGSTSCTSVIAYLDREMRRANEISRISYRRINYGGFCLSCCRITGYPDRIQARKRLCLDGRPNGGNGLILALLALQEKWPYELPKFDRSSEKSLRANERDDRTRAILFMRLLSRRCGIHLPAMSQKILLTLDGSLP
jgi:hypothetical protein